jgi:hypothetical protein
VQITVRLRFARRLAALKKAIDPNSEAAGRASSARLVRTLAQKSVAPGDEDLLLVEKDMVAPFRFPRYTKPTVIQLSVDRVPGAPCVPVLPSPQPGFLNLEVSWCLFENLPYLTCLSCVGASSV